MNIESSFTANLKIYTINYRAKFYNYSSYKHITAKGKRVQKSGCIDTLYGDANK